jgi:hypothetical protein
MKKFSLGDKIERKMKGEADEGNIGPVLVLGQNDKSALKRKTVFPLRLNPIEGRENQSGNPLRYGIDEVAPAQHHSDTSL